MIYQPKPIFSIGKAILLLIIIIFNFYSFDVFAGSRAYSKYECVRDSQGYGLESSLTTGDPLRISKPTPSLYKFSRYTRSGPKTNRSYKYYYACLVSDEPQGPQEPVDDGTCYFNNPVAVESMTITEKTDLPLYQSTDKFGFAGCLYTISPVPNTTKTWKNSCYDFNLTRVDIDSDTDNNSPDLSSYACEEQQETIECLSTAPSSFSLTAIEQLTIPASGKFTSDGCIYDYSVTSNTSSEWTNQCFDYSFIKTNEIATTQDDNLVSVSCAVEQTVPDETSEQVQLVLNNQALLAENQLTILQEQQNLSDNLTQVESNLVSNQNTLLNSQSDILAKQDNILSNDLLVEEKVNNLLSQSQNETAALDNINQTLKDNHSSTMDLLTESSPNSASDYFDNTTALIGEIVSSGETENKDNLNNSLKDLTSNDDVGGINSPISESQASTSISQLEGFFPEAQTCDISLTNPVTNTKINFDLTWSDKLKEMLAWVMAFYTLLALVDILFTPVKSKA